MFKRTTLALLILALALSVFGVTPTLAATCTNYTVRSGDNLFRIGLKFGVSVSAIQAANGLSGTFIYAGQVLCIPTGSGSVTVTPKPSTTTTVTAAPNPSTYTVQPGDTLYRISLKFKTTVAAIQQLNGITSTLIYVGQVLKIPGGSAPTATPTAPPSGTVTSTPPPAATTAVPGTYTVKSGDTLFGIALKFKTTVAAIQQLNGISDSFIYVGQVLKIPGGSAPTATATPPPATTQAPGATSAPPPAGNSSFELGGQVAAFSADAEAKMKFAGMYWVKRQVRWAPTSKASDFFGLITEAHNRGFKVLLSVLGDPGFAVSANFPAYATFVGDLAGAGADGIEIWNEMNIDREWPAGSIGPANYLPMLQQSYNAIKAKNGNTLVISGAPAPTGFFGGCGGNGCDDKPYIEGLVAAGGLNYLDCIGIHYNEGVVSPTQTSGDPRGNPNHYTRYYQTMVNTYSTAAGGQKKLCFTELGYLSGEEWGTLPSGFLWKPPYNLTVAEHALYLGQAAQLSKDQGKVRLMIVFNVDLTTFTTDPQAGYAIIRPNGTCPACDKLRAVTGGR
jgi:LysM repeat protein